MRKKAAEGKCLAYKARLIFRWRNTSRLLTLKNTISVPTLSKKEFRFSLVVAVVAVQKKVLK